MTEDAHSSGASRGVGAGDAPPPVGGAVEVIPLLYDFILWMAPKLAHYPKIHRFTLGDRIMTVLLGILGRLLGADVQLDSLSLNGGAPCDGQS